MKKYLLVIISSIVLMQILQFEEIIKRSNIKSGNCLEIENSGSNEIIKFAEPPRIFRDSSSLINKIKFE